MWPERRLDNVSCKSVACTHMSFNPKGAQQNCFAFAIVGSRPVAALAKLRTGGDEDLVGEQFSEPLTDGWRPIRDFFGIGIIHHVGRSSVPRLHCGLGEATSRQLHSIKARICASY